MAKITITLDDDVERRLRSYVTQHFPEKPFGKLSKIVNEAVKEYLERH